MEHTEPHSDLRDVVDDACRRMIAPDTDPYWIGVDLMASLVDLLTSSTHAPGVYVLWGTLTDGIVGPELFTRGQSDAEIQQLMRQAAHEWLAIGAEPTCIDAYLERWRGWPHIAG